MNPPRDARKWLEKKARRGVRAYPVGTVAFYGPDNRRATKVSVGIVPGLEAEPSEMRRWFADAADVRTDKAILAEVVAFLREQEVHSVAMTSILGCPHEEGIDYPEGEPCPECPSAAVSVRFVQALVRH